MGDLAENIGMTREAYRQRLRRGVTLLLPLLLAACLGACGPAVVVAAPAQSHDGWRAPHASDGHPHDLQATADGRPDRAAPSRTSRHAKSATDPAALLPDGLVWESDREREERRRDWRNGRHGDRFDAQPIRGAARPAWWTFDGTLLLLGLLAAGALWRVRAADRRALDDLAATAAASEQVVSLACGRCSRVIDVSRGRAARRLFCPRCGAAMPTRI